MDFIGAEMLNRRKSPNANENELINLTNFLRIKPAYRETTCLATPIAELTSLLIRNKISVYINAENVDTEKKIRDKSKENVHLINILVIYI